MRSLGFPELLVILGVAVLLFGGKKIPEVAKGLGEGIRNFKHALKGDEEKVEEKKPRGPGWASRGSYFRGRRGPFLEAARPPQAITSSWAERSHPLRLSPR